MTTSSRTARRGGVLRKVGWLSAAGMLAVAALAPAARAASVTPTPINSGNPTCGSFDAGWTQFKLEGAALANGTYSDGTLQVTISGYAGSVSGTPGSFDWTSNIGVDAVFVKAGSIRHNLFVYVPESTGDTDLGPQAGRGNGISHISFCYDVVLANDNPTDQPIDEPTDSPTDSPTDDPTDQPTDEPTDDPTDSPTDELTDSPVDKPVDTSTDSPTDDSTDQPTDGSLPAEIGQPASSDELTGEVAGVTGLPGVTPPPTDTMAPAQAPSGDGSRAALIGLAALLIGVLACSQPRRATRDR